ncbi:MAG: bifunctional UDP-N-acetylglucosamine diphosphorylase/glucosamine-1-phosphate N-acetyltransferase GlmU, partial [bacterium]|nr:bifunctional UDP-N-acetylglucosamine diphosphorylase/glucosamine-1-phosphate N-acetyltransferase GlmU [bacterium]
VTQSFVAIILAAGEGQRMKSKHIKVAHQIAGVPIVGHVVRAAREAGAQRIIVVIGKDADLVKEACGEQCEFVIQDERLGTGHACMCAEPLLKNYEGQLMVLCGDAPLITAETLRAVSQEHSRVAALATILTANPEDVRGMGRIIRNATGAFEAVVEEKDATPEQREIKEINAGFYCFDTAALFRALKLINRNNRQAEYQLPDVFEILKIAGIISSVTTPDAAETIGINDRVWLAKADEAMQKRIKTRLMLEGVTFINPLSSYVEADLVIGRDTTIWPNCMLRGKTIIGESCEIGPSTTMDSSVIGDNSLVTNSVVTNSQVGTQCHIGPFAHLRPQSMLGNQIKIGNFVEVKESTIGKKTKISHLSYIGDAEIGENVNVGAGVIVVNYDGVKKHRT